MSCRLLLRIALVLPVIFLFTGCADDLQDGKIFEAGGSDATISFSVEKVSLTRSGSSFEWESVIGSAYLLFYDSSHSAGSDLPIAAVCAEVKSDSPEKLSFKMPLRLEENKDYRLVAVANADRFVPEGFSGYDSYIESWCGSYKDIDEVPLHLYHPGVLTSKVGSLPMVGSPAGGGMFRFTRENGVCRVNASLSFRRKVARIDVVNLVKEGFAVEGVALCNWRDAVAVDEDIEFVGSVHNEISGFSQFPDADETGIQKLMGELYCFPSCSELSKTNDSNSTALILKARYGEDVDPSYYRINVGFEGSRAEVKPNTRYSVTVTSVKGRGASSPEEAFSSEDDNLVLSMVEDWDLEGCYDMDDNGNFMVLSRASIEFAGNSTDFVEIKILTSKGLEWSSEYRPDGEEAADAFIVSKISDGSFVVSPARENSSQDILGGKCHVSAVTPQGNILSVDISLRQLPGGETPYEPVIPWEKDFALVPLEGGERVKVDHDEMTIEVDGFDPGCFNSFIDIPFMIYVSDHAGKDQKVVVNVSSSEDMLSWPLEGRISSQPSESFSYCKESFTNGSVYSRSQQSLIDKSTLDIHDLLLADGEKIYISVGAMAPDDPEIIRTIRVKLDGGEVIDDWTYTLKVKPRPVIIDDIVLTDDDGRSFVVMDRNMQNVSSYSSVCGRDNNGRRMQAYHFCGWSQMAIPFKKQVLSSFASKPIDESFHKEFSGESRVISSMPIFAENAKNLWLQRFVFKNGMTQNSPFYTSDAVDKWTYPDSRLFESVASRIKMSKMRMFLVSEIPARDEGGLIPICCYIPYAGTAIGSTSASTPGYLSVDNGISEVSGMSGKIFNASYSGVDVFSGAASGQYVVIRLVYPLSLSELNDYKSQYLGYGSSPCKLTVCHSDTGPWPAFTISN